MEPPDIKEIIRVVCGKNIEVFKWGSIEQWLQAEIFSEFYRLMNKTRWIPMNTEVPYITRYPVVIPKNIGRDWRKQGAVKWIDLCLRSINDKNWVWYEFKVRHANWENIHLDTAKSDIDARNAFRKDVVALLGFDANATADSWEYPDNYTVAYWFKKYLMPHAEKLRNGNHRFVTVMLQLNSEIQHNVWDNDVLLENINYWKKTRCKSRGEPFMHSRDLKILSHQINNHFMIVVEQ